MGTQALRLLEQYLSGKDCFVPLNLVISDVHRMESIQKLFYDGHRFNGNCQILFSYGINKFCLWTGLNRNLIYNAERHRKECSI